MAILMSIELYADAYSFTNYDITLGGADKYTLFLPQNTHGTLNINGTLYTEFDVTNDSKNNISMEASMNTKLYLNNSLIFNTLTDYENDDIHTEASSGLITKNWTYNVDINNGGEEGFVSNTRFLLSITGGNWHEINVETNRLSISYTYDVVPEPSIIALIGMGIATLIHRFKRNQI
jgi:hypothetical protein